MLNKLNLRSVIALDAAAIVLTGVAFEYSTRTLGFSGVVVSFILTICAFAMYLDHNLPDW